jgi:hypothetical protein
LVNLTALARIARQISTSFSPSSSFSGILETASVIIFDAKGSKNAKMV